MSGRLIGIGTGPGDPELLTLKAVRALAEADVVAHFAKDGRSGNARATVAGFLRPEVVELPLRYPVTTEIATSEPAYGAAIGGFYARSAEAVERHLRAGRTVAVLSEGDPLFYGSYMHLHVRLAPRYAAEVIPGVTAMSGSWSQAGLPLVQGDDVLSVLPGTLRRGRAGAPARRLRGGGDHEGRAQPRQDPPGAGGGGQARPRGLCRAGDDGGDRDPAAGRQAGRAGALLLAGAGAGLGVPAVTGRLAVLGLGPGPAEQLTGEALAAVAAASDLFGYAPYLDRLSLRPGQTAHRSDNREELARARAALALAAEGRAVAVVSGGDPGVFAMAAAVCEAIDGGPADWRGIELAVVPGDHRDAGGGGALRRAARARLLRAVAVGQPQALGAGRGAAPGRRGGAAS